MQQDWFNEIQNNLLNRMDSISKAVDINIGNKIGKEDIIKAQSLDIINDAICKGECDYLLEKGHKANVGEKRKWGNNEYEKTPGGWKLVSKNGKEYKEVGTTPTKTGKVVNITAKTADEAIKLQSEKIKELGLTKEQPYKNNPNFKEENMLDSKEPATIGIPHEKVVFRIKVEGITDPIENTFYKLKDKEPKEEGKKEKELSSEEHRVLANEKYNEMGKHKPGSKEHSSLREEGNKHYSEYERKKDKQLKEEGSTLDNSLIKLAKQKANELDFDKFNQWYVSNLLLKTGNKSGSGTITKHLGIKENSNIDTIYKKLKIK
jgi:hypothetical protein